MTTTTPVEILASNTSAGADFSATPRSGLCPLPVAFSNLSSGSGITGYLWNFGDGGTSTIADPVHVYKSANTFTVSLTVNVGANSSIRVRPAYILTTACQFSVYLPLIRK